MSLNTRSHPHTHTHTDALLRRAHLRGLVRHQLVARRALGTRLVLSHRHQSDGGRAAERRGGGQRRRQQQQRLRSVAQSGHVVGPRVRRCAARVDHAAAVRGRNGGASDCIPAGEEEAAMDGRLILPYSPPFAAVRSDHLHAAVLHDEAQNGLAHVQVVLADNRSQSAAAAAIDKQFH